MQKLILFLSLFIGVAVFSQETTEKKQEIIYNDVEKLAEFPGGINAFRTMIAHNFRTRKVKANGYVKCEITFVVERDGSIVDVKAHGENESFNQEAVRAVSKIKTKWSPAKINGENVRFRYRIPLTISFE